LGTALRKGLQLHNRQKPAFWDTDSGFFLTFHKLRHGRVLRCTGRGIQVALSRFNATEGDGIVNLWEEKRGKHKLDEFTPSGKRTWVVAAGIRLSGGGVWVSRETNPRKTWSSSSLC
jgi:hypothetical protein